MSNSASKAAQVIKKIRSLAEREKRAVKKMEGAAKIAKGAGSPKLQLSGIEAAYLSAIKSANGITSARPSTLKALKAAEAKPKTATIKSAISALNQHLSDLSTADPKKLKKFEKNIKGLSTRMQALAK